MMGDINGAQYKIMIGDVLERLADLPDGSVHCVATSPPFWGLRDYQTSGQLGLEPVHDCQGWATGTRCGECYICRMTSVFREVLRVLRSDGVCFVEIGDSYSSGPMTREELSGVRSGSTHNGRRGHEDRVCGAQRRAPVPPGLKPKDLCGIPWRLALSLQADGWWIRQELIWNRPNPMPESVTDRCTKSHSYVFLLTKSSRYFYDAEAIREKHADKKGIERFKGQCGVGDRTDNQGWAGGTVHLDKHRQYNPSGRNKRSVWNIPTQSYKGAHFATFPEALVAPMILAGTSERGCCPECGSPWVRVLSSPSGGTTGKSWQPHDDDLVSGNSGGKHGQKTWNSYTPAKTTGWKPSCTCDVGDPVPCTVLDIFAGSCTTLKVAKELGRDSIGIELNPDYAVMGEHRINQREGVKQSEPLNGQLNLFGWAMR